MLSCTLRDNWNTKKMLDFFIKDNRDKTEITFVGLAQGIHDLSLKRLINLQKPKV